VVVRFPADLQLHSCWLFSPLRLRKPARRRRRPVVPRVDPRTSGTPPAAGPDPETILFRNQRSVASELASERPILFLRLRTGLRTSRPQHPAALATF
jgi:hypothetical protein